MLIGDLVIRKEKAHLVDNELAEEGADPILEEEPEETNLHPLDSKAAKLIDLIEFVTLENIKEFALTDVLMPVIGHDVKMPKNDEINQIYNELLLADGISMSHFHEQAKVEATSASGSYRRIVAKPEDL